MKYFAVVLFVLIAQHSFSQISYTDFIQKDNKIEWAAEYDQILNITPKVKKFRINSFLFRELAKSGCIDSYKQNGDELTKSRFCIADTAMVTDSITSSVNPYHEYVYSLDYPADFITNEINAAIAGNGKTKFDILKIKQILIYKAGMLRITNVLVSPLTVSRVMLSDDSGTKDKLVWKQYFSGLINDSNHILPPAEKAKCIDYGNSDAMYNFMHSWSDDNLPSKILTLKNPGFSHHLYQAILDGKITAADDKLNIIPANKFLRYNSGPPIRVPQFDDEGNEKGYITMYNEFNVDSVYKFIINQHFYLDTVKKVLYSEVNYITAVKRIVTSVGLDLGDAEFFRVYFVKPALYRKPAEKRFINN